MPIAVTIPQAVADAFESLAAGYADANLRDRKQITHRMAGLFAEPRGDYLDDGTETALLDIACAVPADADAPYPLKARSLDDDIDGVRVKSRSMLLTAICPALEALPKSVTTNVLAYNRVYALFGADEVPVIKVIHAIYAAARDHGLALSRMVELARACEPLTADAVRAAAEAEADVRARAAAERDDITRKAALGSGLMAHAIAPMYRTWLERHAAGAAPDPSDDDAADEDDEGNVADAGDVTDAADEDDEDDAVDEDNADNVADEGDGVDEGDEGARAADTAGAAAAAAPKTRGPEGRVVDDLAALLRADGEVADLSPEVVPKLFRRDEHGKFRRVRDRVAPMKVAALVAADPEDKWVTYKVIVPGGDETYLRAGRELCTDMRAAAAVLAFYNEAGARDELPAMHTLFGESILEERVWTLLDPGAGADRVAVVMPVFEPETVKL